MSDNLLLSSLWFLPLIGMVVVLAVPRRSEAAIKCVVAGVHRGDLRGRRWSRWACTSATARPAPPLPRDRAAHNILQDDGTGALAVVDESERRRTTWSSAAPWIPYFNIQYYLGLDGISLSLVVLTGLVSVLACLASWNIDKQVKGYLRPLPAAGGEHDGRVPLARPVPVLRLLRGHAAADVLPDRHLGRARTGSTRRSSSCSTRSSARSSSWSPS